MIFLSRARLREPKRESRNLEQRFSSRFVGKRARASGIYSVTERHSLFTNWLKNGGIGSREGGRKEGTRKRKEFLNGHNSAATLDLPTSV